MLCFFSFCMFIFEEWGVWLAIKRVYCMLTLLYVSKLLTFDSSGVCLTLLTVVCSVLERTSSARCFIC